MEREEKVKGKEECWIQNTREKEEWIVKEKEGRGKDKNEAGEEK